jgi:hypothetical protein
MTEKYEEMLPDEYLDSEDIEKLMKVSDKVVGHKYDDMCKHANAIEIMLSSKKNRKRQKEIMMEAFTEMFDNDKFRWSQESQRLDWGHYIHLPKWLVKNLPPFPFALWQLAVTVSLVMIIFLEILNYLA